MCVCVEMGTHVETGHQYAFIKACKKDSLKDVSEPAFFLFFLGLRLHHQIHPITVQNPNPYRNCLGPRALCLSAHSAITSYSTYHGQHPCPPDPEGLAVAARG